MIFNGKLFITAVLTTRGLTRSYSRLQTFTQWLDGSLLTNYQNSTFTYGVTRLLDRRAESATFAYYWCLPTFIGNALAYYTEINIRDDLCLCSTSSCCLSLQKCPEIATREATTDLQFSSRFFSLSYRMRYRTSWRPLHERKSAYLLPPRVRIMRVHSRREMDIREEKAVLHLHGLLKSPIQLSSIARNLMLVLHRLWSSAFLLPLRRILQHLIRWKIPPQKLLMADPQGTSRKLTSKAAAFPPTRVQDRGVCRRHGLRYFTIWNITIIGFETIS